MTNRDDFLWNKRNHDFWESWEQMKIKQAESDPSIDLDEVHAERVRKETAGAEGRTRYREQHTKRQRAAQRRARPVVVTGWAFWLILQIVAICVLIFIFASVFNVFGRIF